MKQIFKSLSALAASVAVAVCPMTSAYSFGADSEEKQSCTVHYDLSGEGVYIPEDDDGNVPELKDLEVSCNSTFKITDITPEREGYYFSGWTADNIRGYVARDVFLTSDEDITLYPVWTGMDDENFHKVYYKVIIDGEEDLEAQKRVPPVNLLEGRIFTVPLDVFPNTGYKQRGWTDGVNEFLPETKLIMHDEDMTLYPNFKKIYNLLYTVGDADRINGVTFLEYEIAEGDSTNLQSNSRFSRNGFKILGWHCETDGKDYAPDSYFEMPGNDVVMTPIWDPINYVINFKPSSNAADNIKVSGYTDTAIIAPECDYVNEGFRFGGWQYNDTVIQPGEEFIIPGAKPGMGISFKAVWIPDEGDITTTTSTATTTTTTATETTTSTVTTTVTAPDVTDEPVSSVSGDANCDGAVDMADVVLIMQALANPNKYDIGGSDPNAITEAGKLNADVDPSVSGLTTNDALAIQNYLLKKLPSLPIVIEEPVID